MVKSLQNWCANYSTLFEETICKLQILEYTLHLKLHRSLLIHLFTSMRLTKGMYSHGWQFNLTKKAFSQRLRQCSTVMLHASNFLFQDSLFNFLSTLSCSPLSLFNIIDGRGNVIKCLISLGGPLQPLLFIVSVVFVCQIVRPRFQLAR